MNIEVLSIMSNDPENIEPIPSWWNDGWNIPLLIGIGTIAVLLIVYVQWRDRH